MKPTLGCFKREIYRTAAANHPKKQARAGTFWNGKECHLGKLRIGAPGHTAAPTTSRLLTTGSEK